MNPRYIFEKIFSYGSVFLKVFIVTILLSSTIYFMFSDNYVATSKILIAKNFLKDKTLFSVSDQTNIDTHSYIQKQADFIKSGAVLNETIKEIDLRDSSGALTTPDKLNERITIKPIWDADMIEISANSTKKGEAELIANSIARQYIKLAKKNKIEQASNLKKYLAEEINKADKMQKTLDKNIAVFRKLHPKFNLPKDIREKAEKNALALVDKFKLEFEIKKISTEGLFGVDEGKISSLYNQLNLTNSALKKFDEEIKDLPNETKIFYTYLRDKKTLILLKPLLESKLNDIKISLSLSTSPAQLVSLANSARKPIRSKGPIGIVLILLISVFSGFISVFVADYLDQSIKHIEDILDVFKYVFQTPKLEFIFNPNKRQIVVGEEKNPLLKNSKNLYPFFEKFAQHLPKGRSLSVGFVSMLNSFEKSFIVSSFAGFLAAKGENVLLIDADPKSQNLNYIYDKKDLDGLVDVLSDEKELQNVIVRIGQNMENVLFFGNFLNYDKNPLIINSNSLSKLFEGLLHKFSFVLIDCPCVDSKQAELFEVLSSCDVIIFIIPHAVITKKSLMESLLLLDKYKNKITTAILSNINVKLEGVLWQKS